jgi:hypothetical protein
MPENLVSGATTWFIHVANFDDRCAFLGGGILPNGIVKKNVAFRLDMPYNF